MGMQLDQNIVKTCALAQFAATYTYNRGNENCIGEDENEFAHELDSHIPEDSDEIGHTNVIKLQNGLGKMRKRIRKAVIFQRIVMR